MLTSVHNPVPSAAPIRSRIQENFAARLHEQVGVLGWEICRDVDVELSAPIGLHKVALGVASLGSEAQTVLVEILPPKTDSLAEHHRIAALRRLPGLLDLVVVNSRRPLIEVWHRPVGGRWNLQLVDDLESSVRLRSLGVTLHLRDLYRRVSFAPSPLG